MTYGDGVSDVDIRALVAFHKGHGLDATLTVVVPPGRFGAVVLNGHRVTRFIEKPAGDGGYINGGFYVLEKQRFGNGSRWKASPAMANSPPSFTMATGSRWTRCATRTTSKPYGRAGARPGRHGNRTAPERDGARGSPWHGARHSSIVPAN